MEIKTIYEDRIERLWNDSINSLPEDFRKEIVRRGYAVEQELPHNDVLFIGMNPAFNKEDKPDRFFYNIYPPINQYFNEIVKFSNKALKYNNPSHHDLLFIRHTKQSDVLKLFDDTSYKEFFKRQLDISTEIIKKLSPKLIVVLNAGARRLFETMFDADKECKYDEGIGAFRFIIDKSTPVLFSRMLSGTSPLDRGSRRSLRWHIQFILNNL